MRPENLQFPQTFYKFKAKNNKNDEIIDYRVQDLPEELYESALQLYLKEFFPDEVFCSSRKLHEKDFRFNELIDFWREAFKHRLTFACFKENGDDELVAVNVMVINSKDDDHDLSMFKDQDVHDILEAIGYTFDQCNVFEKYGVDKYLAAYGLVVNKKYRGLGIATEMLKARRPFLKALGLTLSTTSFTVAASQKAAQNAGYVDDYAISYDDLAKVSSRFYFENGFSKVYKIMSLKV